MKELEGLKVIIKNLNYNKVIDDIEFATMDRMLDDAECEFKNLHLQNVTYSPYQLCPKCNGQGIVSKPPWVAGDVNEWTSSAASYSCDLCNGAKVIPQHCG